MQYSEEKFNPCEYDCSVDLNGNEQTTLMIHRETKKLIVRKKISGINKKLYQQLLHVRHENIVKILGIEETETHCYTYEEYINGKTLTEVLSDGEPVSEGQALDWITQLCKAVKILHEHKPIIIHRDIKPGNIMLTSEGIIKLIDFDAAKEYTSGKQRDTELIGTPDYAAPEQYGFATSNPRTDIYAIGILFHEMLTGHKPNECITRYKGKYKNVILNCIELDPERRYRNIKELERQIGARGITRHIPGFRTGVWWKKVIASVVYFVVVLSALPFVYEEKPIAYLWCFITGCVPPYILGTNFLRCNTKLPLIRSKRTAIKVLGIVLYLLIWLLLFLVATVIYSS